MVFRQLPMQGDVQLPIPAGHTQEHPAAALVWTLLKADIQTDVCTLTRRV